MPESTVAPELPEARIQSARRFAERAAWFLDSGIRLPVIGTRIGLQPIISLVPVAGDVVGFLLTLGIIGQAVRVKAPPALLARMAGNAVVDLFLGLVPIAGDAVDFVFRANTRNCRLLVRHLDQLEGKPPPRPWQVWLTLATLTLGLCAALWLAWRAGNATVSWLLT